MTDGKGVRWLYGQLPELVDRGVLSADAASRLREHYGKPPAARLGGMAHTIFATLGAVFIGCGIVLIFAHNWSSLPRVARVILAFVPMLAGQVLVGWIIFTGRRSRALREGAGAFLALATGACIALVSQAYNITGHDEALWLCWLLLTLPLAYLLDATFPAALYLAGTVAFGGMRDSLVPYTWLLAAGAAPHFGLLFRRRPEGVRALISGWVIVAWAFSALMLSAAESETELYFVFLWTGFFTLLLLIGALWGRDARPRWLRAFDVAGGLGVLVISYSLTFEWAWREMAHLVQWGRLIERADTFDLVVLAVVLVGSLALWVHAVWLRRLLPAVAGGLTLVVLLGGTLADSDLSVIAGVLFNACFLGFGVLCIADGLRRGRAGCAHGGTALVAILAATRFLDTELPFIARGVGFIVVGAGFLAATFALRRRMGGAGGEAAQ